MLTPYKLKPYLLERDALVEDAVRRYFVAGWSRDEDIVPLLLEAARRYSPQARNVSILDGAERFVLNEESFGVVLETLRSTVSDWKTEGLNRILAHASPRLLEEYAETLSEVRNLSESTWKRIDRRTELATHRPDDLWEMLRNFSDGDPRSTELSRTECQRAEDLVEALARKDEPTNEWLREVLESGETRGTWPEVHVIRLLGARA